MERFIKKALARILWNRPNLKDFFALLVAIVAVLLCVHVFNSVYDKEFKAAIISGFGVIFSFVFFSLLIVSQRWVAELPEYVVFEAEKFMQNFPDFIKIRDLLIEKKIDELGRLLETFKKYASLSETQKSLKKKVKEVNQRLNEIAKEKTELDDKLC